MMNNQWVKIGEVVRFAGTWKPGIYAKYAVMELITGNGFRRYKEVLMCRWEHSQDVKAQDSTVKNNLAASVGGLVPAGSKGVYSLDGDVNGPKIV
jgi:hypothetical protein